MEHGTIFCYCFQLFPPKTEVYGTKCYNLHEGTCCDFDSTFFLNRGASSRATPTGAARAARHPAMQCQRKPFTKASTKAFTKASTKAFTKASTKAFTKASTKAFTKAFTRKCVPSTSAPHPSTSARPQVQLTRSQVPSTNAGHRSGVHKSVHWVYGQTKLLVSF
jgi:hypothetical protein